MSDPWRGSPDARVRVQGVPQPKLAKGKAATSFSARMICSSVCELFRAIRSRRHLVIENLALRQQLVTLTGRRHPDIRPADRVFWVLLRRYWSRWAQALAIVRPDTVVRWHRAGFHTYWNWLSRRGKRSGRPPLPREVRALIRRMASENPWGAPRIHEELLCLGFDVSERSVSRYLRFLPRTPRANATWTTFLRNHRDGIAAMDFFTVPTAMFRVLHVLLDEAEGGPWSGRSDPLFTASLEVVASVVKKDATDRPHIDKNHGIDNSMSYRGRTGAGRGI